jgi:hypothetical protein
MFLYLQVASLLDLGRLPSRMCKSYIWYYWYFIQEANRLIQELKTKPVPDAWSSLTWKLAMDDEIPLHNKLIKNGFWGGKSQREKFPYKFWIRKPKISKCIFLCYYYYKPLIYLKLKDGTKQEFFKHCKVESSCITNVEYKFWIKKLFTVQSITTFTIKRVQSPLLAKNECLSVTYHSSC